jgi:hypothetical protein
MHASDVVLQAFESKLQNIPGLEDHIVRDEEKLPKEIDLPWCWLSLADEDINGQTMNGKKTRGQFINVDLVASSRHSAMQAANQIAGLIEDRIDADITLGSVVGSAVLQSITRGRNEEIRVARVRMVYLVTYWTRAGASSTPV